MAIQLNIGVDRIEGIDEIRDRLGESGAIRRHVTPILRQAARVGVESARIHAPKGASAKLTGAISDDAISFRVRGDRVNARFGVQPVMSPERGSRLYPLFVHEGTGIYGRLNRRITAKRKPFMIFPGGGKPWPTAFGRTGSVVKFSVRGQRPQPYMEQGYEDARRYVEQNLDDMMNRLLD